MGELSLYQARQELLRAKIFIAYFVADHPHKKDALKEATRAIETAMAVIDENDESEEA